MSGHSTPMYFLNFKKQRLDSVEKGTSPDNSEWGAYWDDVEKSPIERMIQGYKNRYGYGRFLDSIRPYTEYPILEVGAGLSFVGRIAAKESGKQIIALDFNHEICQQGADMARKDGAQVKWVQGDVFNMPFQEDAFAIVMSTGLLEHFTRDELLPMLTEMRRVGKKVIANIPQYSILWKANWALRRSLGTRLDPNQRLYTKQDMHSLCQQAGFKNITIKTIWFGLLFPFMSIVAE